MLRSRSLTRFTRRVGLEHLWQSVLFWVSITFSPSPVLAIFAIAVVLPVPDIDATKVWPPHAHADSLRSSLMRYRCCGGGVQEGVQRGKAQLLVYTIRQPCAAYSIRSACIGSTREARQAGTVQARTATASSVTLTSTYTAGSTGGVP